MEYQSVFDRGSIMSGFRVFDEAKKAKEKAAGRAGELGQQASEKAGELKTRTAAKAADFKDQAAERASDAMDAGIEKLGGLLDDFNIALPVLREAGFSLKEVEVELGLPPKVIANFNCIPNVS